MSTSVRATASRSKSLFLLRLRMLISEACSEHGNPTPQVVSMPKASQPHASQGQPNLWDQQGGNGLAALVADLVARQVQLNDAVVSLDGLNQLDRCICLQVVVAKPQHSHRAVDLCGVCSGASLQCTIAAASPSPGLQAVWPHPQGCGKRAKATESHPVVRQVHALGLEVLESLRAKTTSRSQAWAGKAGPPDAGMPERGAPLAGSRRP